MARSPKTLQIDEDEQLLVRLAWACEIEGLTQAAAAERFGVTRLRVNKALSDARQRGIVRISINSQFAPCAREEWELCERFSIDRANVVPTPVSSSVLQTVIGTGLAQYLSKILAEPEIELFGMSWGNTLNMATRFMEPLNRPSLEIVSVMGGLSKGSDLNSYEITTRLADLCNAQHSYFTAPIYAGSAESRDILVAQDVFQSVIQKIKSADAIAIAAGDMANSLLMKDGLPTDFTAKELIECGGVGDVLGHILNESGQLIDHPINNRLVGISLSDLKDIPNVILAAGGLNKLPIIKAILETGFVNTLVTDEKTAAALV